MNIAPGTTLVDVIGSSSTSRSNALVRDGILVLGTSILMALAAHASLYLPWITPIPITLQTLVVLLAGATLGSRRGALAMLLYLAEGASGLPVFASGGSLLYLLVAPSAGYLWSYPIAAFVTGYLCERGLDRSFVTSLLAMLPGTLVVYALGVSWLAFVAHLSFSKAIMVGMLPFIPGDIIKVVVAAILMPTAWMIVRWLKPEEQSKH